MATIYIIDDDAPSRKLLMAILGDIGYGGHEIHEFADGRDALSRIEQEQPDLIILDLLMPAIDGVQFVLALRAMEKGKNIEVVFHSANYMEHEVRPLAEACGVRHIIQKPADPEAILKVLREEIDLGNVPKPDKPVPSKEEFLQQHIQLLNQKLFTTVTKSMPRLDLLLEFGLELMREHDPDLLTRSCADLARRLVDAEFAAVLLLRNDTLFCRYISGVSYKLMGELCNDRSIEPKPNIHQREAIVRLHNLDTPPSELGLPQAFPKVTSLMSLPMRVPERTFGWLVLTNPGEAESFSDEDETFATILVAQVARVFENALLHAELKEHVRWLEAKAKAVEPSS